MKIVLLSVAAAWLLFVLYLAYCAIFESRRQGKLQGAPLLVRAAAWSVVLVAGALDVLFNFTVGTAVFLELPRVRAPTLTQRCARHLDDDGGWRRALARWVCDGWLNPFQIGHCRERMP